MWLLHATLVGFGCYLLSQGPLTESNNDFVVLYFMHVLDFFWFSRLDHGPYFMDFVISILNITTSEMNKGLKNYFEEASVCGEELDPRSANKISLVYFNLL